MLLLNDKPARAVDNSRKLASFSGAYAELTDEPERQSLRVYSRERKLVFEYDPVSGKTSVYVPSGDLEFVTQQGDIIFTAARGVVFRGQTVQLVSSASIRIAVTDLLGRIRSALTLQAHRAKLSSTEVALTARRGELQMEEVNCTAKTIAGRIGHARLVLGKLERFAQSVIEKATNVYSTVEGVLQLKAGRMRTLLEGTYHFKARRSYLRAQEDFKINADKIHLG